MSKLKLISALVAGIALSSGAQAVVLSSGVPIDVAACVDASNPILLKSVTVNLSKGVQMGYTCRLANAAATPATINRVGIGACHIGGSAKSRDVPCTGTVDTGYTPEGCTAEDVAATPPASKPVSGTTIFFATTAGGTPGEDGMATVACNGTGVSGLVEAKYPE